MIQHHNGLVAAHHFFLEKVISAFQTNAWPRVQAGYKKFVEWCLVRYRPIYISVGVVFLFVFSLMFFGMRNVPVVFFPQGEPNFIYAYIRMPIGTHQNVTDSVTGIVEDKIIGVLTKEDGKNNH